VLAAGRVLARSATFCRQLFAAIASQTNCVVLAYPKQFV
jgi:hypothetical protein